MAALALGVAYLAFGWPVLVVGVPLFVGVVTTLAVLLVTERPRQALRERRDGRSARGAWRTAAERGDAQSAGLMSGFFEISPQVQVPSIGEYPIPSQPTAREVSGRDAAEPAGGAPAWHRRLRISRDARPARV